MLDYIGGHIMSVTKTRAGHNLTLRLQHGQDEASEQPFHICGRPPGELGDKLVVIVLDEEVVGWHNQATGEQGCLLQSLPRLRWRPRDAGIALVVAWVLYEAGSPAWGLASGLGWIIAAALWRRHAMRSVRGELVEALDLAAGVQSTRD